MKNKFLLTGLTAVATLSILTGCGNSDNNSNTKNSSSSVTASSSSSVNSDSSASSSQSSSTTSQAAEKLESVTVTVEEAIKHYQTTYPDSDITNIELDKSFGSYYYKIEGVDDTNEYKISVNAETAEISKDREEALDADEQNGVKRDEEKLDLNSVLGVDEAATIAEKQAGSGTAVEWELSKELNTTYWEIKVKDGTKETSVKIDAQSGEVLETELDD